MLLDNGSSADVSIDMDSLQNDRHQMQLLEEQVYNYTIIFSIKDISLIRILIYKKGQMQWKIYILQLLN